MKKSVLILVVLFLSANVALAQTEKVAYVYSEKIFKSMTEYTQAVAELETYAERASLQSERMLAEVKLKYEKYKKEGQYLSGESNKAARKEIVDLEKSANTYEETFFKEGGIMESKKKELMKPIEDKVVAVINQVAEEKGYDMIFDLSVAQVAIYKKPSLDVTELVISKLK